MVFALKNLTTNNMHQFSLEYFNQELMRFREIMGNREIMLNIDKREVAFAGFCHVYFNTQTNNGEDESYITSTFKAITDEFTNRCLLIHS